MVAVSAYCSSFMAQMIRPTYQAVVTEALRATGASSAWLLAVHQSNLVVVATGGTAHGTTPIGTVVASTGTRAYVMASAQPAVMMPNQGDPATAGTAGVEGSARSILVAPCGEDAPMGLLELANKTTGESFSFEDMELASSLAAVAGAALGETRPKSAQPLPPKEIMVELEQMALTQPDRYSELASVIAAVTGRAP